MNGNEPPSGNFGEEKESELEYQAEFVLLILSAIGYKIFESKQKISTPLVVEFAEEVFYLYRLVKRLGGKINAQMKCTLTGYKVLVAVKFPLSKTEM